MYIYMNQNRLVVTSPCSWGFTLQRGPWKPPPPFPPWGQGSRARLKGNAGTNPFLFLVMFIFIYLMISDYVETIKQ